MDTTAVRSSGGDETIRSASLRLAICSFMGSVLETHSRATGINKKVHALGAKLGVTLPAKGSAAKLLATLEKARRAQGWTNDHLADALADVLYEAEIQPHTSWLPTLSQ
jgi:hypothetical protein